MARPPAAGALALILVTGWGLGCGGIATTGEPGPAALPEPSALFVAGDGCAEEADVVDAEARFEGVLSGESLVVVEVFFASECTGLGGQYLLGRTLDGSRSYWLGGHGCYFFDDSRVGGPPAFGVLRASQTAALFHIDEEICVGFPGGDGVTSDSQVQAVALFETEEEARRFAASVGS